MKLDVEQTVIDNVGRNMVPAVINGKKSKTVIVIDECTFVKRAPADMFFVSKIDPITQSITNVTLPGALISEKAVALLPGK